MDATTRPVRRGRLSDRALAWLALVLLVPAQTIGLVAMLYVLPGSAGKVVAALTRVWLLVFPWAWVMLVEGRRPPPVRISRRGLGVGAATGVAFFAVILGFGALAGDWLDVGALRARAALTGFDRPLMFAVACAYIVLVNPLLEEYFWRWFVLGRVERAAFDGRPTLGAAILATGFFTIHHAVSLAAWVAWQWNVLGCAGVFVGGLLWARLYQRYGSIWPGYVSHAFADLAIVILAYDLVFRA